jgi:uroporphyrinogen-III synthase
MASSSGPSQPLRGRAVLVTRPVQQAAKLAQSIAEIGGEPVLFPALAIEAPADPDAALQVLRRLSSFDLAIFVSPNAVEQAFRLLRAPWPASLGAAALGEATATALRRRGVTEVLVPAEGSDSEGLLEHASLQSVHDKRIAILRGEGGRDLLAEELRRRGAEIAHAECYRRTRPAADPSGLIARWREGGLHAVTAMSGETLDNLWAILGEPGQALLSNTPLFVPHAHIGQRAMLLGLTEVAVTPPGDEGILRGLTAWFALHVR